MTAGVLVFVRDSACRGAYQMLSYIRFESAAWLINSLISRYCSLNKDI